MPWNNPTDVRRLRRYLGYEVSWTNWLEQRQAHALAIGGEDNVTYIQGHLTELDSLDAEIGTAAIEIDFVSKADEAEFIQGGKTQSLRRRSRQLIQEIGQAMDIDPRLTPAIAQQAYGSMLLRG